MSFDAGAITGKLTLDDTPFDKTLRSAKSKLGRFGSSMGRMGGRIAKSLFNPFTAALAGVASVGAAGAALRSTASSIDQIAKTGARLGVATEQLTGLHYAAKQSGVQTNQLDMGLQRMTRRIADAAHGGGEAVGALDALGLSAQQLAGMSPDQQFLQIADAMEGVQGQGEKVRLAFKLFDSEGVGLINTMKGGSEAVRAQMAELKRLGGAFNDVDAAKVQQANDALGDLGEVIRSKLQDAVIGLAPYVTAIADKITGWATTSEGASTIVMRGIEWVAVGVAKAASVLDLFMAGWHGLRAVATGVIGAIIKLNAMLWQAIYKLVDNPVGRKLFGLEAVTFGRDVLEGIERFGDAMMDSADESLVKSGAAWDRFASGERSAKVAKFFDDAKAKAQEAAEKATKATKPFEHIADAVDTIDTSKLEAIDDAMADLRKEVEQFGMTDLQKRLADFSAMEGVTPEKVATFRGELEKLRKLQGRADMKTEVDAALSGIETPFEKLRKAMDKFRTWFNEGLINRAQFDRLTAKTRTDLFGGNRLAGLVRAGSAEAQALRYQQAGGQSSGRDFDRQQVDEQKETNRNLVMIGRYFRQQLEVGEPFALPAI